jgi:NAD(P)-dependent dehydrogenase (short-subunit alcohol dehydrogenase family)
MQANSHTPKLAGKIALVTGGASGIGLASNDSSFVNGIELFVDGGMSQI